MPRRLSSPRYRRLISQLAETADQYGRPGADPLPCIQRQLRAVLEFISSDPALGTTNVAAPLHELNVALHDLAQGGKPHLFAGRSKGGRPPAVFTQFVRAFWAAALDVLIEHGRMPPNSAVAWLHDEIESHGLTAPTAKALLRWREDARAEQWPGEPGSVFTALQKRHRAKVNGEAAAKRAARSIIAMHVFGRFPKTRKTPRISGDL